MMDSARLKRFRYWISVAAVAMVASGCVGTTTGPSTGEEGGPEPRGGASGSGGRSGAGSGGGQASPSGQPGAGQGAAGGGDGKAAAGAGPSMAGAGPSMAGAGPSAPPPPPSSDPQPQVIDPTGGLPKRDPSQKPAFCSSGATDKVARVFCADTPPTITGMKEFAAALGLDPNDEAKTDVALAANSTSLTARSTSAINPRVFIFPSATGPEKTDGTESVIISYVRGEPLVELAANSGRFMWTFYLARIEKACAAQGCTNADFLTDKFETGWSGVSMFAASELRDTPVDCAHCHSSRGGTYTQAGEQLVLFVEEARGDVQGWGPWFDASNPRGKKYVDQLYELLGNRTSYGIVPKSRISTSDPKSLWNMAYFSFHSRDQPRLYRPETIENEVKSGGKSATWQAMYDTYTAGSLHAPPHYANDITDPAKLAKAIDVARRHAEGKLADADVPDFRDVFAHSKLVELGHLVEPLEKPEQTIAMACGQCHNAGVDKSLIRSRFNALAPSSWTAQVKASARTRLMLESTSIGLMPPLRYRSLSDAAKQQIFKRLE